MITRTKLVIGTLAAGLALAACASVAGTSGQGNHGKPVAQHQVQGNGQKVQGGSSGAADIKDLAAVKRDLQRAVVEDARARTGLRGVLGGTRPGLSPDSGLAGCSSVFGAHQAAARDYPEIADQFTGSRWPDLRISGLAYVEIATKLRATHAYGGEAAWVRPAASRCLRKARAGRQHVRRVKQLAQVKRQIVRKAGGKPGG